MTRLLTSTAMRHLLRRTSPSVWHRCKDPSVRGFKTSGAEGHPNHTNQPVQKEYAFEMVQSNLRYGGGVSQEAALDFRNMGVNRVCIMTDNNVSRLAPFQMTLESFHKSGIGYELYTDVQSEPTEQSFKNAIEYAKQGQFEAYLAVGGGSVIDTCKAANLCASNPDSDLLDYVNAPLGRGLRVKHSLKPMIAVPTTTGTGSESTGVAVFDYKHLKVKTGISDPALRPTLALVDPLYSASMPERVAANCGFDVLCHVLESFTALPYDERIPRPKNPSERPVYQGSHPISDIWIRQTLRMFAKYFKRAVYDARDHEARSAMHLASAFAGIGFGSAGTHLCHAMSYPIAGMAADYVCPGYSQDQPNVPHGLSVVLPAPAVFRFLHPACPERHLEAAELLGVGVRNVRRDDAGRVLSDFLLKLMYDLQVEDGLQALGYTPEDIPALVKGAMSQVRLTKLSPRPQTEEDMAMLFAETMKIY